MEGITYLIHLEQPIAHSQHYLGWTRWFKQRINHHRRGTGSRFLAEAVRRGIAFDVVRQWKNTDGNFERKLKNRKKARLLCPVCKQEESEK